MRRTGPDDAEVVDGEVIGVRLGPHLKYTIGGAALVAFCSLAVFGIMAVIPRGDVGLLMSARFIGLGVLGALMLLGSLAVILYVLIRQRRFIVGEDRLQLVAVGRVLGQVPYDNILEVRLGTVIGENTADVEILLRDHKDKRTWWPNPAGRRADHDICIQGGAEVDGTLLRMVLREAIGQHQNSGGKRRRR